MKTLIVGGGIGGLTAAVALKRIGMSVEVVERTPVFAPVGAGITIQANAMAVLQSLSVSLPEDDTVPIGAFQMINARGQVLMSGNPTDIPGVPSSVNIHRADLHRALLAACEGIDVRLDSALTGLAQDADGVTATFSDGREGRWDLVVGVDGIGSQVRRQLGVSSEMRYAGQTCWRFALHAPDLVPDVSIERWTPGRRCGIIPMSRGRIYVYLVQSAPEGSPGPGSSTADGMRALFSGIDERLDPILERLDESVPIHHGDLYDLPVISFGEGRALLLGDAAHAMTPNMGQGAGTAIEDAAGLALLLKQGVAASELAGALDALRRKRVTSVQTMSWRIGKTAHMEGAVLCWARDLALRMMSLLPSERQARAMWQPGIDLAEDLSAALA